MPEYRVFLTTADHYLEALKSMAWLMNKYWQPLPEVVVVGFALPDFDLPSNWTFASMGNMSDYPFDKWSNALIEFLNAVDDEVFLLSLEDMWPIRQVDTEALDILYHYMLQFEYVAKMDLCGDRLYSMGMQPYGHVNRLDLVKSMPGSPYHLSLMPGFWRREHLLRALIPNESPHQVETIGTLRLSHQQNVIVLGSRQWPLRVCLALRGGDSTKLLLDEIDKDDVIALREMGYLEAWE